MPTNDWYRALNDWRPDAVDAPDPVDDFYGAVNDWRNDTPVAPSRRSSSNRVDARPQNQPQPQGYYPQPETYYQPVQRQQGPAPLPVEPPRSTYKVDPLKAAINRWQQSNRPDTVEPVRYEVPQQQFDYEVERPDTGPSAFTAQQYKPPTVQSRQPVYDPNAPAQQQQGLSAWLPNNYSFSRPIAGDMAANLVRDPQQRQAAWNLLGTAWEGAKDEVQDSAAYERFQFDTENRARNFAERGGQSTLSDVWDATKQGAGAMMRAALIPFGTNYDPERSTAETVMGELGQMWQPWMEAANTNRPTARIAQGAQDVLSGLQLGQDYAMTGFDLPGPLDNDLPLGPNYAGFRYSALQTLFPETDISQIPLGLSPGETEPVTMELVRKRAQDFINLFQGWTDSYREAVTPTPEQETANTSGALAMNRERSFLNWATPDSVEATYDALNNRSTTVASLNQQADEAWEAGAMAEDEQERQDLWAVAAEAGSEAWVLENSHPQQIVNENTNILAQLLMEVTTPDVTDLLGGFFSLAGLTPAARRLTRVTNEVMTPEAKVMRALDEMVVTGENAAQVAAQRSSYNKAWNLWSTGQARAGMATDKMTRYVVNLLSDVETPRDAVILMQQLASDPRKLISGVDASLLQSTGLLARADEKGLVKFGTMGIDNITEPLRIYQQAAQDVMASPALRENALLNKADFMTDFTDSMNNAGYRFYNVANDAVDVPTGAKTGRVKSVGKGEYVVEFVDANKAVVGTSEVMPVSEARKLKNAVASGEAAQKSLIGEVAQFQRSLVSPFYILTSPGTWATNLIGGIATAAGDGMVSLRSSRYIDDWTSRMFGVDPTQRGLRSVESISSSASQFSDKGPLKFLKRAYGQIDEQVGKRVFYKGASDALRKTGGQILENTLGPILATAGVDPTEARRIVKHLHEVGMQGGNLTDEFNRLLNGQTNVFSLSEVNPTWLEAAPPDSLNELYSLVRGGGSKEEILSGLQPWMDNAVGYWDELIASSPPPPQRYSWQKIEVTQDAADIQQAAAQAQRYGNLPAEQVQAAAKTLGDGMTEAQRRLQTLTEMVTEAADPANRYALYNVWGQMTDYTANVRTQLTELAEAANVAQGPQKTAAWQTYWSEAQRLWTERNTAVNKLLEDSTAAMSRGEDFTPRLNTWDILERTARTEEAKLWQTLRLEPQSGRYDARLQQVIQAGRSISDQAVARTYAAARRFLGVDAMDYLTSAEHNIQIAGSQVSTMLRKARETAAKTGKWEDYYGIRNEAWRQLRTYEKQIWENSTRSIVREGLGQEATTGLRFDAGPDGLVEIVAPRTEAGQATNRMGPQKTVAATERTVWDVRREDGTITQVPDNMVPTELKSQYNGVTDATIADNVELELDNIASAYPYADDAQRAMEGQQRADNLMNLMMEDTVVDSPLMPVPGSRALEEAEGLRAERATIDRQALQETRATIRTEWDRVASAEYGKNRLDQVIAAYTRNGRVQLPGRFMEDLYGKTIAGQRIESTDDLNRLLQDYYDFGQAERTRNRVTPPSRDAASPVAAERLSTVDAPLTGKRPSTPQEYAPWALARTAQRNNIDVAELERIGNEAMAQFAESPIMIQVPQERLDAILDSRQIKTQFDVGQSSAGGNYNPAQRRAAELAGFGIPENAPSSQRPVYGYFAVNERATERMQDYGDLSFVLKDDVRARTTVSMGDSLSNFANGSTAPSPINAISPTSWADEAQLIYEYSKTGNLDEFINYAAYVEAQIAGGVRLEDIATVVDPKGVLTPAQIQRLQDAGITVEGAMRSYDFTMPQANWNEIAQRFGIDLGNLRGKSVGDVIDDVSARTTAAGAMQAGEVGHGAAFAKQQLENIVEYLTANIDEIITPKGKMIGEGSNLAALQEFRTKVLPAWDNVKYAASEYGNRMRSFTMVDFANNTRLDELMGLYMPYGFWMTRTVKNSMERAIFQPQIWRRVMQTERDMRSMQEQEGAPQRYEGAYPVDMGDGTQQWLRILPSKYWPTAGMFTMNDYADPESANSALGFATESLRAANLQGYAWWDIATKLYEGKGEEIYYANYLPQGRIAANLAIKYLGQDAAQWIMPGYFENSVARTLNNMAVKGDITRDQARWAHDYLWQLKNGGEPLPEAEGAYDAAEIETILDEAMKATAGIDLRSALISYTTGASLRQYDPAEGQWTGAAGDYQDFKYGPDNPYGSKLAADSVKPDAQLTWSKGGVWRPEEQRPGASMATDAKSAEKDALNQTLMDATDEFIRSYDGTPANFEINDFKSQWMAEQVGGDPEAYYVENMSNYLDQKYPSATTFDGAGFQYEGYAPEEVRQRVRVAAYYKAKEELEPPTYPEYPGDEASRAEKNAYFEAKDAYDLAKVEYDTLLEELTNQYIADPYTLRELTGRYTLNPSNPGLVNDFARSLPKDMTDIFGYPVRPTGDAEQPFSAGLTPLAGDPEDAAAIIEQEKTKYMSDLEKKTRAENEAKGKSSKGYSSNTRYPYSSRRSSSRGYSRRSYGGGGGGGGSYYVPPVESRGLSEWLYADPQRAYYEAPRQEQRLPDIGPEAMQAWRPISWS